MLNTRALPLSIQLSLVLALIAMPAAAAPAAHIPERTSCAVVSSGYPLGLDGGLTGLSRGEIASLPAGEASSRPSGVDGGVMSLLFIRSAATGSVASTLNACTAAFSAQGG